jgi:hypothetical protein
MTIATGSNRYLAFIEEVTAGTTPTTPTLAKIRNTGGSGITNERSSLQSGEIRVDRGISDIRLGQNQPGISIPVEFSYASFDSFLRGAFGSRWIGGVSITGNMTATGATMTYAGNDFSALGLNVGDYIVVDATTAANDGVYKIKTIGGTGNITLTLYKADGTTDAALSTVTPAEAVTIISGYKGGSLNTATNNITVAGTAKTYTAASAYWITTLGLKVGDMIFFAGFSTSGNNGWKKVVTVTDTVLTVSQTCTNESLSSGLLETGSKVAYLKTSTSADIPSFTVEEGFEGISQYHSMTGAKVDKFSISCQPDKMIDGSFDLVGMNYSGFSGTSIATALSAFNANNPFDSYTGTLNINSNNITQALGIVSGVNIQLSNGLSRRFAVMSQNAASVGEGRVNVSGSINVFFSSSAPFAALYSAETDIDLELRFVDLDGNAYIFYIPKLKFTKDSRSISETDVTESLDFQALIDSNGVTMSILKQPVS